MQRHLGRGILTPLGLGPSLGPRKCSFTIVKLDPWSDRQEPGCPRGTGTSMPLAGASSGVGRLMAPSLHRCQLPVVDPNRDFGPGLGGKGAETAEPRRSLLIPGVACASQWSSGKKGLISFILELPFFGLRMVTLRQGQGRFGVRVGWGGHAGRKLLPRAGAKIKHRTQGQQTAWKDSQGSVKCKARLLQMHSPLHDALKHKCFPGLPAASRSHISLIHPRRPNSVPPEPLGRSG